MTPNLSLDLSIRFQELLRADLLPAFRSHFPYDLIEQYQSACSKQSRERIFTPTNTLLAMLLSATQEDKSQQQCVNVFKHVFEQDCRYLEQEEKEQLDYQRNQAKDTDCRSGRPRKYKSKLPKTKTREMSDNTAAYSKARKKIDKELIEKIFIHSTAFGLSDKECWHGMQTYISDGTYLQLQDTNDIKSEYYVKEMESSYPQALLQVFIRQGTGQISQFSLGSRQESELKLVIPMINQLGESDLLLADDLYNSYYHFALVVSRKAHIIVPGKRDRNYTVVKTLSENDQIVRIRKTRCPLYLEKEEWALVPETLLLRRITYRYPTKNGLEECVLFTTILDENIKTIDIILKYSTRWDIEISIREIKTLMGINILRSKSREMMWKELTVALIAYNLVRKVIAQSADTIGISPQEDIFQKCAPVSRPILMDKKGRVFYKWSTGRYGKTAQANKSTFDSRTDRYTKALFKDN